MENKSVYICSILALLMLAASPTRAAGAEVRPAPAAASSSSVRKSFVRVDPRTGRLVRATVVLRPPEPSSSLTEMVDKASRAHDVDPLLVDSVIRVESGYDPNAISPKGAQGLMQLMPSTAQMLGVQDSLDPAQNIEAGVKYLKYLQDLYKDDRLALAAYNAGPAAVDRYKQVPPYPETQTYVERVGKKYGDARKAASQKSGSPTAVGGPLNEAASAQPGSAKAPAVKHEEPHPQEQHVAIQQYVDSDGRLHLRTSQ